MSLLSHVNVSTRLRDHGIPKDNIPELVKEGMKYPRLFIPNPGDLSEGDVKKIYTDAW